MKTLLSILCASLLAVAGRDVRFGFIVPPDYVSAQFGIYWGTNADVASMTNGFMPTNLMGTILFTNLPDVTIYAVGKTLYSNQMSDASAICTNSVNPIGPEPVPDAWTLNILSSTNVTGPWLPLTNVVATITNPSPNGRFFRLKITAK